MTLQKNETELWKAKVSQRNRQIKYLKEFSKFLQDELTKARAKKEPKTSSV